MSTSLIRVGTPVTVPQWGNLTATVVADHGSEVTLSNGERIYKAKCFPVRGTVSSVRAANAARKERADKIGRGRR